MTSRATGYGNGPRDEPRLRVVVCEPYAGGSHLAWAQGLAAHSRHDLHLITHPGRFWKWRMQGAALTLAEEITRLAAAEGRPDVLLVSEMVHVPALLGFAREALANVPVVLYLHENQLTYPSSSAAAPDETYAMTNWLSMAAADLVVFNSRYHRNEVLAALPPMLKRFPDHRHTGFIDDVVDRTAVLPVGIDTARFAGDRQPGSPPVVLWNHRWEYDKDPATFFAALEQVAESDTDFKLAVAGESFQTLPPEFAQAREQFRDRIIAFGTAPDDQYPSLLRSSDIVVSTARHEFFGVAVVEAIAAGALPLLPDALSYPDLVPDPASIYLYPDPAALVERLRWALTDHAGREAAATTAREHVQRFDWRNVAPLYDRLLNQAVAGTSTTTEA